MLIEKSKAIIQVKTRNIGPQFYKGDELVSVYNSYKTIENTEVIEGIFMKELIFSNSDHAVDYGRENENKYAIQVYTDSHE